MIYNAQRPSKHAVTSFITWNYMKTVTVHNSLGTDQPAVAYPGFQ